MVALLIQKNMDSLTEEKKSLEDKKKQEEEVIEKAKMNIHFIKKRLKLVDEEIAAQSSAGDLKEISQNLK